MPDIQYGGEAFPVEIEPDPWEIPLAPELQELVGKPWPEFRIPTTETTDVLLPIHQLGRSRTMIVFVPHVATSKRPLPEQLADHPLAQAGVRVHQSIHDYYENLAGIGYYYTFVVTTQNIEELREIVRPEPRQQFPALSDPDAKLADILSLPTFTVEGKRYFEPIAFINHDCAVEKIVYPIQDPEHFAQWAFNWTRIRRPDLDFLNYNLDRGSFTRKQG